MEILYVFADFDWMDAPRLIGQLFYDSVRGSDTYGFSYDNRWLKDFGDIFLSDDLIQVPGRQYAQPGKDIFSCFSDALPDRWGKTLITRREQIQAREEKRAAKRLSSFDYLTGIDDTSRMGGFRFKKQLDGHFINTDSVLRVPPVTSVRELMMAANEIEKTEEIHTLPALKWINQLLKPGTSLGGARPKASVIDTDGSLTVAKFPSRKDDYDVAGWEHFCHIMGHRAGIRMAETRLMPGTAYNILLSKRFDRRVDGKRIHFASALTLLGLSDGDNASTGKGYLDIVDFIIQHAHNVEWNLEELYRRIAFNIIVGNSDDHFRNHGFMLSRKGWELSPAYDINPTLQEYQSLLINPTSNEADLNILFESSELYMLPKDKAKQIISEVKEAMSSWQAVAAAIGLPKRDIDLFAPRFTRALTGVTG